MYEASCHLKMLIAFVRKLGIKNVVMHRAYRRGMVLCAPKGGILLR